VSLADSDTHSVPHHLRTAQLSRFHFGDFPLQQLQHSQLQKPGLAACMLSKQNPIGTIAQLPGPTQGTFIVRLLTCKIMLLFTYTFCKNLGFAARDVTVLSVDYFCAFAAFYPRDAMLARVIVIATCLSVCPSRAGIVSKRRKLAA